MERIMATLTDKQQSLARTILLAGVSTHGTRLRGIVSIDFDSHAVVQRGFIGDHGLQFSKRPLGMACIGFTLLFRRFLALLAFGALADICQVLQANKGMGMSIHDALTHDMIGVLLQPSHSSTKSHKATTPGTRTFFLTTPS